jgi:hypothetical protein
MVQVDSLHVCLGAPLQIEGEMPARTREIPHSAVALEWSCVVCDEASHEKATVGTTCGRMNGVRNSFLVLMKAAHGIHEPGNCS